MLPFDKSRSGLPACIDTDGLDNVGVIYRAYHGLKGNGTGTNLYKRVCALPIKEGDEPLPELP